MIHTSYECDGCGRKSDTPTQLSIAVYGGSRPEAYNACVDCRDAILLKMLSGEAKQVAMALEPKRKKLAEDRRQLDAEVEALSKLRLEMTKATRETEAALESLRTRLDVVTTIENLLPRWLRFGK